MTSGDNDALFVTMLNSLRRSIVANEFDAEDTCFVGTILEQNLREIFDRCPDPRLHDHDRGPERKRLDLTLLLVKESNRARRDRLPTAALEFVDRALALWTDPEPHPQTI